VLPPRGISSEGRQAQRSFLPPAAPIRYYLLTYSTTEDQALRNSRVFLYEKNIMCGDTKWLQVSRPGFDSL